MILLKFSTLMMKILLQKEISLARLKITLIDKFY